MAIMTVHHPLLSIIAGTLILIIPRLLNYIIAIYLIVIGILGLMLSGNYHLRCKQVLVLSLVTRNFKSLRNLL